MLKEGGTRFQTRWVRCDVGNCDLDVYNAGDHPDPCGQGRGGGGGPREAQEEDGEGGREKEGQLGEKGKGKLECLNL